jgi:hypothetical protein
MLKNPGKSILPEINDNYNPFIDKEGLEDVKNRKKELEMQIEDIKKSGYPTVDKEKELEQIDNYLKESVGLHVRRRVFPSTQTLTCYLKYDKHGLN